MGMTLPDLTKLLEWEAARDEDRPATRYNLPATRTWSDARGAANARSRIFRPIAFDC
jgi:hypothetical protein